MCKFFSWNLPRDIDDGRAMVSIYEDIESVFCRAWEMEVQGMVLNSVDHLVVQSSHDGLWVLVCTDDLDLKGTNQSILIGFIGRSRRATLAVVKIPFHP